MDQGACRHSLLGTPQGSVRSPLVANIDRHEVDRSMERYTALSHKEREKRKRQKEANFLDIRSADDGVVLGDGTKEQAEARRKERSEFLDMALKLELAWEKTQVTPSQNGFEFRGFAMARNVLGSGQWAPRLRMAHTSPGKGHRTGTGRPLPTDPRRCGADKDPRAQ
jgi:RNA-directed DNA polymerase